MQNKSKLRHYRPIASFILYNNHLGKKHFQHLLLHLTFIGRKPSILLLNMHMVLVQSSHFIVDNLGINDNSLILIEYSLVPTLSISFGLGSKQNIITNAKKSCIQNTICIIVITDVQLILEFVFYFVLNRQINLPIISTMSNCHKPCQVTDQECCKNIVGYLPYPGRQREFRSVQLTYSMSPLVWASCSPS